MACVCKEQKVILMKNLAGEDVLDYPVYVYNINEEFIGHAYTKEQYLHIWNSDPDNNAIGELFGYYGKFSFLINIRTNQNIPICVLGNEHYVENIDGLIDVDNSELLDNDGSNLIDI